MLRETPVLNVPSSGLQNFCQAVVDFCVPQFPLGGPQRFPNPSHHQPHPALPTPSQ